MLRFLVPVLVTLSSVTSLQSRQPYQHSYNPSAASASQIKFAIENKYDETGPGAKTPEYAYNTYKTLEEALVAYLSDPDTQLPEHEREKAINKLIAKFSHKPVSTFSGHQHDNFFNSIRKPSSSFHHRIPVDFHTNQAFNTHDSKVGSVYIGNTGNNALRKHPENAYEPFKIKKFHSRKVGSSLSLAHYTRDPDIKSAVDQFNPLPKYSYSYGVNDKGTGDVKQAAESRDGDTVYGFYSFINSDGKHHTVRYTADHDQGFQATISKTPTK